MREIKFRALAIVNDKHNNIKVGDFVYGHYIESGCDAPCIIFGDGEQIEVDKKTLGQFTGKLDKYNKDVYEGDIWKRDSFIASVEFEHSKWSLMKAKSSDCYQYPSFYCNTNTGYLIGNIHQNPELLKE